MLQIVRTNLASGGEAVVSQNAGTVDYDTGVVWIKAFIAQFVQNDGVLSITAKPKVQEIVPRRNQLLTVDPENVKVTLVDDTAFQRMIATGQVASPVTASTTSSYESGIRSNVPDAEELDY